MKRTLITSNRFSRPYKPAIWVRSFEKHLGKILTSRNRAIISKLERQHHLQQIGLSPKPILFIDPPDHDSSNLLLDYLSYRLHILHNPDIQAVVFSPKTQYPSLCHPLNPKKRKNIRHINYRRTNRLRGQSPGFILLLNLQDAEECSPIHGYPDKFRELCHTLFPMQSPYGFLILHIRLNGLSTHHFSTIPPAIKRHLNTKPKPPDPPPPITVVILANVPEIIGQAVEGYSQNLHSQLTNLNSERTLSRYAVLRSPKLNRTARAH